MAALAVAAAHLLHRLAPHTRTVLGPSLTLLVQRVRPIPYSWLSASRPPADRPRPTRTHRKRNRAPG